MQSKEQEADLTNKKKRKTENPHLNFPSKKISVNLLEAQLRETAVPTSSTIPHLSANVLNEFINFLKDKKSHTKVGFYWNEHPSLNNWFRGEPVLIDGILETKGAIGSLCDLIKIIRFGFHPIASDILNNNLDLHAQINLEENAGLASALIKEAVKTNNKGFLQQIMDIVIKPDSTLLETLTLHKLKAVQQIAKTKIEKLSNNNNSNLSSSLEIVKKHIPIDAFFNLLKQGQKEEALGFWENPTLQLQPWFFGASIKLEGQEYTATADQSKEYLDRLVVCVNLWDIIFEILAKNIELIKLIKSLPSEKSEKLLNTVTYSSSKGNLQKYMNLKLHSKECVENVLKKIKNEKAKNEKNEKALMILEKELKKLQNQNTSSQPTQTYARISDLMKESGAISSLSAKNSSQVSPSLIPNKTFNQTIPFDPQGPNWFNKNNQSFSSSLPTEIIPEESDIHKSDGVNELDVKQFLNLD